MFVEVLIDVGKCTVVVIRILCHMHAGSADGGSVAAVWPWLGAGTTGGVVCGVVSPAPKRIWLFGQSRGQLKQALRVITSSSSAPWG